MVHIYDSGHSQTVSEPGRDAERPSADRVQVGTTFADQLGRAVRENPASAALISMGVAWLFMGGSRVSLFGERAGGRVYEREAVPAPVPFGGRPAADPSHSSGSHAAPDALTRAGSQVGETASRVGSVASDAASAVSSRASEALSATSDGVGVAAHRAAYALSSAGSSVFEASQAMSHATLRGSGALQQSLSELFERQPLAIGAVGLAIGAGLAAALPRTEMENRVMGEASSTVKEQAQGLISDQLQDGAKLAEWALREITREAKAQGLSADAVADLVRSFAEKVTSVASESDTDDVNPGAVQSTTKR